MRLVALVALTCLLSGCADFDPEAASTGAEEPPEVAATTKWTNETFSGRYVGVDGGAAGANPLGAMGEGYGTQSFSVPEEAARLEVTLRLSSPQPGEEVIFRVSEPSCRGTCGYDVRTQSGTATVVIDGPEAGTWRTAMMQGELGPGVADYEVFVGVLS